MSGRTAKLMRKYYGARLGKDPLTGKVQDATKRTRREYARSPAWMKAEVRQKWDLG